MTNAVINLEIVFLICLNIQNKPGLSVSDDILQNSYSSVFEPIYLPSGPRPADYHWTITVGILDVYWATRTIELRAKIGSLD